MLQIARKYIFHCKLRYLGKATYENYLRNRKSFSNEKELNPSNNNYAPTTTVITNLIFLVNTRTHDLQIYHQEQNLAVSCLLRWSLGIIKIKLPMQCAVRADVNSKEVRKT